MNYYFLFNLTVYYSNMQQRTQSKSKLTQYASVKDLKEGYHQKDLHKKSSKPSQTKSNKKHKLSKNNTQSQSKIKVVSKNHKNN